MNKNFTRLRMKHIKNLLIFFLTIGVCACTACNDIEKNKAATAIVYDKILKANWLLGSWQNISTEGTSMEIWEKINDSVFAGKSWFIAGKDTVSSETIRLEQTQDGMFYIPIVKNQNNGEAVKFTLTSSSEYQLIFENPAHDFPQKITYRLINNDSLFAEISGNVNGKENAEQFPMSRVK